ncbi:hypothetical protein ACFW04_013963 [Cataglyphis niger]
MKHQEVIEESQNPWVSPAVMVRKKDGSIRFCFEYKKLNTITVKDSYPIPRIDDIFDQLHENFWFSPLDLKSEYWQVKILRGSLCRIEEMFIFSYFIFPKDNDLFLDTDASNYRIGMVSSQIQDEVEKIITYYSRVLNKSERNYCVTRRELLAIVDSLKSFHLIYTDVNS